MSDGFLILITLFLYLYSIVSWHSCEESLISKKDKAFYYLIVVIAIILAMIYSELATK